MRYLYPIIGIVVALAVWELLSRADVFPSKFIPPATTVLGKFFSLLAHSSFWSAVEGTMAGWALGLAIAVVLGVPLGLLVGSSDYPFRAFRPVIEFLRPVPSVALIPLAVLVFGPSYSTKLFLVTFASFWPILIQSIYGVKDVDQVAMDTARTFRLGPIQRFFHVTLPSASPYIVTGIRLSSSIAIILAVTAGLVVGVPGLGSSILLAESGGAFPEMYALIIAAGILGFLLSKIFRLFERVVLRWHPSQRRSET
jgi:ABC-type nitrate/sulfonate/bicarbonate transport system permease component